ncbi:MAG: GNAT family N-acetyltransferase [Deltaproteobacteria bacterium]|nr:GNAT family N-acetyltransferase [Deltaproteobacteria bacterium]
MELQRASDFERQLRDRLTYPAWGQRLTPEQYLERERRLRAQAWAATAMRTWLLVEEREVLASCETFAMGARFRGEKRVVEGVASVFVEERLRGKRYASAIFEKLLPRLRDEGALASILFSDVGESIYARVGYAARPALERLFSPEAGAPANVCDAVFSESMDDLRAALADAPEPDDALLLYPSAVQLDWHIERERIYAQLVDEPRPPWHGARAGRGRAVWAGDLKNDQLVILWLAATRSDEALALIQAARRAAHGAGLSKVVLWECAWPFELAESAGGGRRVRRADSIPMIAPLVSGLDARDWGQTSRGVWI